MKQFLADEITAGKKVVIAGTTGSGKITFAREVMDLVDMEDNRAIFVEEPEELKYSSDEQLEYVESLKIEEALMKKPNILVMGEARSAEDFEPFLDWELGGSIITTFSNSIVELDLEGSVDYFILIDNHEIKEAKQLEGDALVDIEL